MADKKTPLDILLERVDREVNRFKDRTGILVEKIELKWKPGDSGEMTCYYRKVYYKQAEETLA